MTSRMLAESVSSMHSLHTQLHQQYCVSNSCTGGCSNSTLTQHLHMQV